MFMMMMKRRVSRLLGKLIDRISLTCMCMFMYIYFLVHRQNVCYTGNTTCNRPTTKWTQKTTSKKVGQYLACRKPRWLQRLVTKSMVVGGVIF